MNASAKKAPDKSGFQKAGFSQRIVRQAIYRLARRNPLRHLFIKVLQERLARDQDITVSRLFAFSCNAVRNAIPAISSGFYLAVESLRRLGEIWGRYISPMNSQRGK